MSLCRSRLFFEPDEEQRSENVGIVQTLNFDDSDNEIDSSCNDVSMGSAGSLMSPRQSDTSDDFWGNGMISPTPVSSPQASHRRPIRQGSTPLPLPFHNYREAIMEEDGDSDPVPHPVSSDSPPYKRVRALRLYDTPHTPKSLLQKAHRRLNRSRLFGGSGKDITSALGTGTEKKKLNNLHHRPLANVNPFTPNNNTQSHSSGTKRTRSAIDR